MSVRLTLISVSAVSLMLGACAPDQDLAGLSAQIAGDAAAPFRDADLAGDAGFVGAGRVGTGDCRRRSCR